MEVMWEDHDYTIERWHPLHSRHINTPRLILAHFGSGALQSAHVLFSIVNCSNPVSASTSIIVGAEYSSMAIGRCMWGGDTALGNSKHNILSICSLMVSIQA